MRNETSHKLFLEAQKHIPGGVSSPVRAFKSVGGTPPFIVRAKGAYVYDADGNTYIDYVGSWGPAILGHAAPEILNELNHVMKAGLSFGAPTPKEIELAQKVKAAYPSVEKIRFVSSGTEATMSAIRVARGFTGKNKIIKFDGCYHGHADYLLVKAGSGAETCGVPNSLGVPASFTQHTLVANFNDTDSVEKLVSKNSDIAAIIIEPIIGNMGCIPPQNGFLKNLRDICNAHKIVLIFDEVMTGFRVAFGGAQETYGVKSDMTCLGKIIGGGLPVGAYGGRADIMDCVAPLGGVYQAGTLSGNPLAMAVGCKTLDLLHDKKKYVQLEKMGSLLENELRRAVRERPLHTVPLQVNRVGSMFSFFFSEKPVIDGKTARAADKEKFVKVFHHALENGIYLAPSAFEAAFISLSHTENDIHKTVDILAHGIKKL